MKTSITIDITIPQGMTTQEVLRLFTDHHNYQTQITNSETGVAVPNPQNRAQFAKATIARQIKEAIQAQKRIEAEKQLSTLDIVVE